MGWDGKGKVGNDIVNKVVILFVFLSFYFKLQEKERKLPKLQMYPQNYPAFAQKDFAGGNKFTFVERFICR